MRQQGLKFFIHRDTFALLNGAIDDVIVLDICYPMC